MVQRPVHIYEEIKLLSAILPFSTYFVELYQVNCKLNYLKIWLACDATSIVYRVL